MSYVRENDFFIVQMNHFGLHILIIMFINLCISRCKVS